ncbi:MAG: DUF1294 domain-containing protein [Clostridia bacterium]|nr:DUF1294 domain-containing protein [Clostridia bacterium]
MTEHILKYTLIYLIAVNIISAIIVIYDKHISKLPRGSIRRIAEKTFVQLSLLGGGIGTLFTMLMIRHKTKSHDGLLLKIAGCMFLWIALLCAAVYFN